MVNLDLYNNPNTIYNAIPNRNLANAYNEVLNAQQVLNNPNLGGANFTPKQNLMDIYKQASAKNTPAWAMALSNAIPSIGEIVALGATKGAFNQGRVAEGLDKQKQRQMAYNQWLQENEQNKAKDFVQMAKEQLGMDREDENKKYARAYQEAIDRQKQDNWEKTFDYGKEKDIADRSERTSNAEENRRLERFKIGVESYYKSRGLELDEKKLNVEIQKLANTINSNYDKFSDSQKAELNALEELFKKGELSPEQMQEQINSIKEGKGITLVKNNNNGVIGTIVDATNALTDTASSVLGRKKGYSKNINSITQVQ